jgi:hypothetical protein
VTRLAQSVLGVLLLAVAAVLALSAVTSKGVVVLTWPLASVIAGFGVTGGFFISKSLMVDAIKTVAGAAFWRVKPPTP